MRTTLDVVNSCLSSIGEAPLLELDYDHPLAATAQNTLQRTLVQEMSRQWWFNTDFITLKVANDRFIYAPADAVAVNPLHRLDLTLRGRRMYDRINGTYEMTADVQVYVVRNLPYEDLPPPAQTFVEFQTVLLFQTEYDADPTKTQQIAMHAQRALVNLNAEHIRQIAANPLLSPSIAKKRHNVRSGSYTSIPVR